MNFPFNMEIYRGLNMEGQMDGLGMTKNESIYVDSSKHVSGGL